MAPVLKNLSTKILLIDFKIIMLLSPHFVGVSHLNKVPNTCFERGTNKMNNNDDSLTSNEDGHDVGNKD